MYPTVTHSILFHFSLFSFTLLAWVNSLSAQNQEFQMPQPGPEHEVLKHELGTWKAEATIVSPEGEMKTTGKEVNRMLGGFWLVSDFEMDMGGATFHGQGTFGYDSKSKKYIGSWVDSMNPNISHMTGTWNAQTRTFSYEGEGLDMMGNPEKSKATTVLSEDGQTRTFTRWVQTPGGTDWTKQMVIVYQKQKE